MNAVVTIAIGPEFQQMAALTAPLLAGYARRINADFLSIHQNSRAPHFEKFRLRDLLQTYERIIYLDTDVIVKDNCPNLLELVSPGTFGAWFPSRLGGGFEPVIAEVQRQLGDIGWRNDYFNSGVMVLSQIHRDLFAKPYNYVDGFFEQTLINYRVQRAKIPVIDLGYAFNHTGRVQTPAGRFASQIIHYAGAGHIPGTSRVDQIRHDLQTLGKA